MQMKTLGRHPFRCILGTCRVDYIRWENKNTSCYRI